MKLKYLGTAAAEGIPAIFCDCENCKKSISLGGRNIRTRSQALIDDTLLIDFPCDTYSHILAYSIDLNRIKHCLITHIHEDHFYPIEFNYLKNGFSKPNDSWSITVYGSEDVKNSLEKITPISNGFLNYKHISPFETITIGKYTVTALKAYHGTDNPYIYAISDGEKSLLYAHDTDVFTDETMDFLRESGCFFNLVSLDCTSAADENMRYHGHMNLSRNIECRKKLVELGVVDNKTLFVLNHFSHNGSHCVYEEFVPLANENGFETSFDGMEIYL